MVFVGLEGGHDHSARNPRALARRRLSPVLALEIPMRGRPQIDADLRTLILLDAIEHALGPSSLGASTGCSTSSPPLAA
jgi:hypothetical protein